jgi:hypothetical protein
MSRKVLKSRKKKLLKRMSKVFRNLNASGTLLITISSLCLSAALISSCSEKGNKVPEIPQFNNESLQRAGLSSNPPVLFKRKENKPDHGTLMRQGLSSGRRFSPPPKKQSDVEPELSPDKSGPDLSIEDTDIKTAPAPYDDLTPTIKIIRPANILPEIKNKDKSDLTSIINNLNFKIENWSTKSSLSKEKNSYAVEFLHDSAAGKVALLSRVNPFYLNKFSKIILDTSHRNTASAITAALIIKFDDSYFESRAQAIISSDAELAFSLNAKNWKCERSAWQHTAGLDLIKPVTSLGIIFYNAKAGETVFIENLHLVK